MIDLDHLPPEAPPLVKGHRYVRLPEPIEFPAFEPPEEEVSETKRHLENRTALYLVLKDLLAATSSIGSEQFIYFDPTSARRCLSPDAFVKLDLPDRPFGVWKTWERGAPELAVEILSDSDRRDEDWNDKLVRYRAAGIRELVRFDADDPARPIRIWDHLSGDMVERAADDPNLCFCNALDLWWVVLDDATYGATLRLAKDRRGRDPLPTPEEGRMRAEMALQQLRQALLVAEHEKLAAEQKLREASEARLQAEGEIERLKEALAQARQGG